MRKHVLRVSDTNRVFTATEEAGTFGFRMKRHCTIYVVKTKALISCTVDLRLCFRIYAESWFSHGAALKI